MKRQCTRVIGYTSKNTERVAPFLLLYSCRYLEGIFLNRGLDPILLRWRCLLASVRVSTPCGVVSTRESSVFVLGLSELMEYGRISGTGMAPYAHRARSNASPPALCTHPLIFCATPWLPHVLPGWRWLYELHSRSAIRQCHWGFHTMQSCVDQTKLGFIPRLTEVLDVCNDL